MDIQAARSSNLPAWIAAIALIVISAAGISALMGWIPISTGAPVDAMPIARLDKSAATPAKKASTKVPAISAPRAKTRCTHCGVVKSVREVAAKGVDPSYEVTVLFEDGSSRMIIEAALPPWHDGDPVKIVNDVIRSDA